MRPKTLVSVLTRLMKKQKRAFITSPPGSGKTSIVQQVARDLGLPLTMRRAVTMDPVDVVGVPQVVEGRTKFAPPSFLPMDPNYKGILFLDEFPQAKQDTQAALQQLIDGQLDGHRLPDGMQVILAGNRVSDRAGANRVITPVLDRCCQLELDVHLDDWMDWAADAGICPFVRAFLSFRSGLLSAFDPAATVSPTPRSWENLSDAIGGEVASGAKGDLKAAVAALEKSGSSAGEGEQASKMEAREDFAIACGYVGRGAAVQYMAFRRIAELLPDIDEVLKTPESSPVPTETSVVYAISGSLVERCKGAKPATLEKIGTYANRMPDELKFFTMNSLWKANVAFKDTEVGARFIEENLELLAEASAG